MSGRTAFGRLELASQAAAIFASERKPRCSTGWPIWSASTPSLSSARRPGRARRPGPSAHAEPPLRRADPDRARLPRVAGRPQATSRRPASWPGKTPSFAAEADQLAAQREQTRGPAAEAARAARPERQPDIILEVKAGEGGEESALFAGDLLRMYLRYAERRGWKTEILDSTETGLGGVKDATVAVKGKGAEGAWSRLKYEGGVHRVQRVPVTESQGRIHTSAAGVLVLPEAEQVEVQINDNDLQIDVFRSSGPGRAEREHDRLGRADHPPADRHRRVLPEREEPAAEQGAGDAHPARPAARARPRPKPTRRPPPSGAARSAPSTGPSGSAPTTSPRTGSPTTGSATRPTTSTRCSTATSTR